jgi:3-oxoacyl-[acyl-carrier protein] reductase
VLRNQAVKQETWMTTALDFSGRSVLVVGGSSGIGNATAQAFLAQGAQVAVWGTRASAAAYAAEPGSDLAGLAYSQVDVADPAQITAAAAAVDRLDVLVLAQGTVLYERREFTVEGFSQVVNINLNSLMTCAQALRPRLQASTLPGGGSIIVYSSVAAYQSTRGNPAYNASKAGAVALVRTLGEAWAGGGKGGGIRVNGIAPGLVDTKLTKVTTANPQRLQGALAGIPLGRLGTPQDMAGVALFLASPLAAYVVGQTIIVDGGMVLS